MATTHHDDVTPAPAPHAGAPDGEARPFPSLHTGRLALRPFRPEDGPAVERLAGAREIADTTLTVPHPYPAGGGAAWIATHAPAWEAGARLTLAIVPREDPGELLGAVGVAIDARHAVAELGYWIGVPHWGRGYATEAAAAVVRHAFDALGVHRVQARHLVRNPASGRVMRKLGMRFEGVLRGALKKWGVSEDVAIHAVLAPDLARPGGAAGAGAPVAIRAAGAADAEALVRLTAEVQALHVAAMPHRFRPALGETLAPAVARMLTPHEDRLVLVAVEDGAVVGHAYGEVERPEASPFKLQITRLLVHQLGVLDTHRGRGIGAQLLAAIRAAGAARGATETALQVYAANAAARDFYLRAGFRPLQELLVLEGEGGAGEGGR